MAPHDSQFDKTCAILENLRVSCREFFVLKHDWSLGRLIWGIYRNSKDIKKQQPDVILAYTLAAILSVGIVYRSDRKTQFVPMFTGLGRLFCDGKSIKLSVVSAVVQFFLYFILKKAKLVVFQNEDDLQLLLERRLVSKDQSVLVVRGSGVNTERFPFVTAPKQKKVVMLSRLLKEKGFREYCEAVAIIRDSHPGVQFVLGGSFDEGPDGIMRDDLAFLAESTSVKYIGFVDNVQNLLASASIVVLPSYYREGVPRILLEALATGRPIITTESVGCRETVIEGWNGFIVAPKAVSDLARAISHMLDLPDSITREMGLRSRQKAENEFEVRIVNEHLISALEQICDDKAYI